MSNDSNEPGNDTPPVPPPFQVGDRVRFETHWVSNGVGGVHGVDGIAEGVVVDEHYTTGGYMLIRSDDGEHWARRPDQLTLISRVAFGIGDRVRYADMPAMKWREGVVEGIHGDEVILRRDRDGERRWIGLIRLTLISRATPASAPAMLTCDQCGNMGYADSWPFVAVRQFMDGQDQADAVLCEDCWRDAVPHLSVSRADSEPATPALAATAGTVDMHTLELPVEMLCEHCAGTGVESGERWDCPACEGRGSFPRCIRLSNEALDRLAGELAKRMVHDIRMIANDRP